jgi:hypothetical protein
MWNRHLLRLWVAAFGGIFVIAGCGASLPQTTSSASGSRPPPAASRSVDSLSASPTSLVQLKTFLIQASDLPDGWNSTPYKGRPDGATGESAMAKCMGTSPTDSVTEVHSDTFFSGGARIGSSATSYRSRRAFDGALANYHNPKLAPCFAGLLKRALANSNPPGTPIEALYQIMPGSAGYPSNVAAIGTGFLKVGVKGNGTYLSTAYITGPLMEAEVDTFNNGQPVPPNATKTLFAIVANRIAKG